MDPGDDNTGFDFGGDIPSFAGGDGSGGDDAGSSDQWQYPVPNASGDSADADFAAFLNSGQVPGSTTGSTNMDLSSLNLDNIDFSSLPNLGTTPDVSTLPTGSTAGLVPVQRANMTSLVPAAKSGARALARIAGVIVSAVGLPGLASVASALGLDAGKLLQAWMKQKVKRRRGRGVTGRQLATTRRTLRVVTGMYHQLEKLAPHRRAAPSPFHRKHKK